MTPPAGRDSAMGADGGPYVERRAPLRPKGFAGRRALRTGGGEERSFLGTVGTPSGRWGSACRLASPVPIDIHGGTKG